MNKWLELLIGIILVIIPIFVFITNIQGFWGQAVLYMLAGGLILGIFFLGILFLLLGISDLKE